MEKRSNLRVSRGLAAALLCFGAAAAGVARTAGAAAAVTTSPCTGATAKPIQHVVLIMMENKEFAQISGNTNAPYINTLMSQCAVSHGTASTHPSLPNYIALTSGSTQGVTDDNPPAAHPLNVPSLFSQLAAGGSRSLEESMPSNCYQSDSGEYAVRHNPEAYYTNL